MASLLGSLHRPLPAVAAVAIAAVTSELPDWFSRHNPHEPITTPSPTLSEQSEPLKHHVLTSNQSFSISNSVGTRQMPNIFSSLSSSSHVLAPALLTRYQYAKMANNLEFMPSLPQSEPSDVLYRWHLPDPRACMVPDKSRTLVVLLGWLGAKQKHLKKYVEWYTSRGFNVVTFTFPMSDIVSYKVGGKSEQILESLASHLAGWVDEESEKKLVFHTFSNTGWLTYGVILEKFRKQDPLLVGMIKGCIVDSAPVAAPDPQVWASGFSAAFLKKQSVATKGVLSSNDLGVGVMHAVDSAKPAAAEAALLAVLKKFFEVVLNFPSINRRLSDVLEVLSTQQPKCAQLYIYSSADRVIPVRSVESFIERQRRAGHKVRACDFVNSPHVDHFRNHPSLYSSQLTAFLEDYVLTCCCKEDSS